MSEKQICDCCESRAPVNGMCAFDRIDELEALLREIVAEHTEGFDATIRLALIDKAKDMLR